MGYLPIKPFLYVQKAPTIFMTLTHDTLQWRHNERDGISHHRRLDCLLNRLFRHRSKKTSKLCITGLCEGFIPSLNKLLDKQSSCQWFDTSWCSCDVAVMWLDLMQCASGIRLFLCLAYRLYIFSCDQAALQMVFSVCPSVCLSVRLSVCPSVCLSHVFDYVPIIVSSWNFQELLPVTEVTSMQKVKVRGQRSRSQRSQPNFTVSGL